jgi:hypothetical protein
VSVTDLSSENALVIHYTNNDCTLDDGEVGAGWRSVLTADGAD